MENGSAAEAVLQAVGQALRRFPFSYQGSRTLSGQEEGAFGWVTLNYLDQRLKQVSASCPPPAPAPDPRSAAGLANPGGPGPGRGLHPDQLRLRAL